MIQFAIRQDAQTLHKSPLTGPRALTFHDQERAPQPLTTESIFQLACAVDHFGKGQNDETLTALAWVMLNRHRYAEHNAGGSIGPDAAWQAPVTHGFAQALAAVATALLETESDPTNGSIRFHHHLENPSWTTEMALQAIVGPFLFYSRKV